MSTRPIIFGAPMVRAIIDGTKTQTRRVIAKAFDHQVAKLFPRSQDAVADQVLQLGDRSWLAVWGSVPEDALHKLYPHGGFACPFGAPGDHLYVKEAFCLPVTKNDLMPSECEGASVAYEASADCRDRWGRYRHARFMPRWASRITLEVTEVRVERVQSIESRDAWQEGTHCECMKPIPICAGNRDSFMRAWNTINAKRGLGWEANPWCWCVSFKRVEQAAA